MKNIIYILLLSLIVTGCSTVKQAVVPGMTPEQVKLAWNEPQKITNHKNSCCQKSGEESWYYFHTQYQNPKKAKYIFFKDGLVQDVFVW